MERVGAGYGDRVGPGVGANKTGCGRVGLHVGVDNGRDVGPGVANEIGCRVCP